MMDDALAYMAAAISAVLFLAGQWVDVEPQGWVRRLRLTFGASGAVVAPFLPSDVMPFALAAVLAALAMKRPAAWMAVAFQTAAAVLSRFEEFSSLTEGASLVALALAFGGLTRGKVLDTVYLIQATPALVLAQLGNAPTLNATWLTLAASLVALAGAVLGLGRRRISDVFFASALMHTGVSLSVVVARALDGGVAAFVTTCCFALGLTGFGLCVHALDARDGDDAETLSGRIWNYPRLAGAAFVLAGATVGLPLTLGFVADDLVLHVVWEVSPWAAGIISVGTAVLAVTLLRTLSQVFFGAQPMEPSSAPDLTVRERAGLGLLMLVLLGLGLVPSVLVDPATQRLKPSNERPVD